MNKLISKHTNLLNPLQGYIIWVLDLKVLRIALKAHSKGQVQPSIKLEEEMSKIYAMLMSLPCKPGIPNP